ncbi:hypothetical protein [Hymenobacter tenuis]
MKIFFLGILLLIATSGFAQIDIPEAGITFILPNKNWKLINKEIVNDRVVYHYKRLPIKNADGIDVIPNIAVIVESVGFDIPIGQFSNVLLEDNMFNIDSVYARENKLISFKNAVAYKGSYEDRQGLHTVYVVHAMNGGNGIQILFDVTADLFKIIGPEFRKTLKSIMLTK